MKIFPDATIQEIDESMKRSWLAFQTYKKTSLKQRADFMRAIARSIDDLGDELIEIAMQETNLAAPRLQVEKNRTIFQLTSYADACERGDWLQVRIDNAIPTRNPPKPDIRKTQTPLGPVVVFGASNFPFAYSTAGGDTACALAAGCTVVVKAHPAHPKTSEQVANAIIKAARSCNMPEGIFEHIYGSNHETGKALVTHPYTKSVAFTGSFAGGKALFDWGNERQEPIPVFAEMGSINPVFLLSEKLQAKATEIAKMYAASITLSVGQFCTKPGLIVAIESEALNEFKKVLTLEIASIAPATMLHAGIAKAYIEKKGAVLALDEVSMVASASIEAKENQAGAAIVEVSGNDFLQNTLLHQEVFGPYSLIVKCNDVAEMTAVAFALEGQLTATIMATDEEMLTYQELLDAIKEKCGRIILNGVPTGVEVCLSMHHGGPFPATTDSRFTAVGADGIRRFSRPLCYQNWNNELLPDELKNENLLEIWRTVDDVLTKKAL